jgi:hypothetical protein
MARTTHRMATAAGVVAQGAGSPGFDAAGIDVVRPGSTQAAGDPGGEVPVPLTP